MKQDNGEQRLSKWTQQLHDKLAEHETPAPDGLWDDLEAALAGVGTDPTPAQSGRTRFVALRRWATAAAIAALVCGGGMIWWGQESQKMESLVSMAEEDCINNLEEQDEETHIDVEEQNEETPLPSENEVQSAAIPLPCRGGARGGVSNSNTCIAETIPLKEETQTPPLEGRGMDVSEEPQTTQPKSEEPQTTHPKSEEPQVIPSQPESPTKVYRPHRVKHTNRNLSLSLYAMNGLGTKDNSNGVMMADALAEKYANTMANAYTSRRQSPIFLTGYEEREHHRQPVSFGLSVSYPFTQRLSLTSGIVYTKMRSDFEQIIRTQQINKEQTLHYVGIPLGLNYRLWQLGARSSSSAKKHGIFTAYVSTGFQADWNVDARQNTEGVESHLDKDKMQWSVNASLGLQYNLMPQLALYAEPGISHYFDNGSNIQNFFKDKPTSLRLQVGIRMTIDH